MTRAASRVALGPRRVEKKAEPLSSESGLDAGGCATTLAMSSPGIKRALSF